jgi:predicted chitinase
MQLTHKENYQQADDALELDLVGDPDQVATPEVGFESCNLVLEYS